jgi:4-hydroxybenzoate polyprenyltransferase
VNPKNLILTAGAAAGLAQLGLSTTDAVVATAVFVVIASLTIVIPVLYALVGGERARRTLDSAKAWLSVHDAAVMAVLFVVSAALLNPLCLVLSPVALAWITVYSYSKRLTSLSHLWLGVAMAMSPVGGYLAVTGRWSTPWWVILLLALVVTCWGGGFDVLYSLQDESFDREHGLRSLTVALGAHWAIVVARLLHGLAAVALVGFGLAAGFGAWYYAGAGLALGLLVWEHRLVHTGDYSRLDAAFFAMNGIISAVVMAGAVLDAVLR